MTVCIVAECSQLKRLVYVWDGLISSDYTSTTGAMKLAPLNADETWSAMFAGDVHRFGPLTKRIRASLSAYDLTSVVTACEEAFKIELLRRVETEILLPYGWTRDEFFDKGRERLGEVRFGYVADQITQTDLGISLLVAGFDPQGQAHIFEMDQRGTILIQDQVLFHSIGNGRFTALGALYPEPSFCYGASLWHIVYRLCAAKFAAESTPGVGPDTTVFIISPTGERQMLFDWSIDEIRKLWKTEGQPPVPAVAVEKIASEMKNLDTVGSRAIGAVGAR